jgi:flavin-dependent dehydrogenase
VPATYDLAIIGGGINGCGIARDAAGRGLAVHLCEMPKRLFPPRCKLWPFRRGYADEATSG